MGTSKSSPGPGPNSPLVPPWADSDPEKPLPDPPKARFKSFRTALGSYVRSGDDKYLKRALNHYAAATGGSSIGPRRFGAMAEAGGRLAGLLGDLRQGGDGSSVDIHLPDLAGKPVEEAIDQIAEALSENHGDTDKIRAALNYALSECLEGQEEFNPANIDDSLIAEIILGYVSDFIFTQIINDSNKAFEKSKSPTDQVRAENRLLELINAVVENHLKRLLDQGDLRPQTIRKIQLEAIKEVWEEWESIK